MSEEKLTVAELLARSQKSGSDGEAPRRRRRRSLEEGGISVAELTGSIPRVDAEGPRRGAHALKSEAEEYDQERAASQQSESDTAAETTAAGESAETGVVAESDSADSVETAEADEAADTADVAETDVAEADETAAEVEEPEADAESAAMSDETAEFSELADGDAGESTESDTAAQLDEGEAVEDETVETETAGAETAEAEDVAEDAPSAPAEVHEESAAEESTEAAAAPAPVGHALPMAVPLSPRPVMYNEDRFEITYTFTELRSAENLDVTIAEPGSTAREILEGSLSYDDRPTSSIPVVRDDAVEEAPEEAVSETRPVEVSRAADAQQAPVERAESTSTAVVDSHTAEPETAVLAEIAQPETDVQTAPEVAAPVAAEPAAEVETKPAAKPAATADTKADTKPAANEKTNAAAKAAATAGSSDYVEDNSLSIPLLILQVIVGLVVGSFVFIGFALAWERLPQVVAIIMALAVTALLVLGTNMLRRRRDVATPILAGLVGLALTFGPWVLFNL